MYLYIILFALVNCFIYCNLFVNLHINTYSFTYICVYIFGLFSSYWISNYNKVVEWHFNLWFPKVVDIDPMGLM